MPSMQWVKLIQKELNVDKPVTLDLLRQFGVVRSCITDNKECVLGAFNLYPRPSYPGTIGTGLPTWAVAGSALLC